MKPTPCDYPPCPNMATTRMLIDGPNNVRMGHLCDEHAIQARDFAKRWKTMGGAEQANYIKHLMEEVRGLTDEQRAHLGQLMREAYDKEQT